MTRCPATIPGATAGSYNQCIRMRGHGGRCHAGGDLYFVASAAARSAPAPIFPAISHAHTEAGASAGVVAYVSFDQNPEQYRESFDAAATIELLERAVAALKNGDGIEATKTCGAAWFRISTFHHS